jgi:outer membrane protein TolC
MYDAEIASINAASKGAWTWMPPEIGTGFFMMPYNTQFLRESEGEEGMGQYMISIQQMLPNRKRQVAEFKYMESMSKVEFENRRALLNELMAEAKKNYYEGIVLQKKLAVIGENEKLLEFMIRNAEIRYKNGLDKINAYYKVKAALGTVQSMKVMLENEIEIRKINLNTLMNRDKSIEISLDTSIRPELVLFLPDTLGLANRSDLRGIERNIEVIGYKQQLERTKLRPEFGVRFDHMIGLAGQPEQYTAMAMMRIPFASWSAKMNKANIESMDWQVEGLKYQRQMLLNEWVGMASSMHSEWLTKKKQLEIYSEEILPALRNNFVTMQLGYEQNTEELFELFDAWEALNMAELDALDQLQVLFSIGVEIEKILELY